MIFKIFQVNTKLVNKNIKFKKKNIKNLIKKI